MIKPWNKKLSTGPNEKDEFGVSANLAYGDPKVKVESTKEELYEEPGEVVGSAQGHSDYELTETPGPSTIKTPPDAQVYDTVDVQREQA